VLSTHQFSEAKDAMGVSIEELMARFKCPPGVRPSDIIRTLKPARLCKGKKGKEFYACLSRVIQDALIKAGCKPFD